MAELLSITDRLAERAAAEWISKRQKTIRSLRTETSLLAYIRKAFLAGSDWTFKHHQKSIKKPGQKLIGEVSKHQARAIMLSFDAHSERPLMMFHGWGMGYEWARAVITGRPPKMATWRRR